MAISQKYPDYESLLADFEGEKSLKEVGVSRGVTKVRLGESLANRIYKALFSLDS